MSVRQTVSRQYARVVDNAAEMAGELRRPPEGWLVTLRKALGMSARQVGERAGITKTAVYQAERNELAGGISVRQLEKLAGALGGRLVYAIVPDEGTVSRQLQRRAQEKAKLLLRRASVHMALEKQAVPETQTDELADGLRLEFARDPTPAQWDD